MERPKPLTWLIWGGSVAGALVSIFVFWAGYGWVTNNKYNIDHAEGSEIKSLIESVDELNEQVIAQGLAWQCDEWSEDLRDLDAEVNQLERWVGSLEDDDPNFRRANGKLIDARRDRRETETLFNDYDCEEHVKK